MQMSHSQVMPVKHGMNAIPNDDGGNPLQAPSHDHSRPLIDTHEGGE